MNGILPIDKPKGYTSFDAVARIRSMTKTKRVGHSGTLDPMATGVLLVFIGAATKAIGFLSDEKKAYCADFCFGVTTDTLDSTGTVLTKTESAVTASELLDVLPSFLGEIEQIPPMYSAVKVGGHKLYELARKGIETPRAARKVTIDELTLLQFDEKAQTGSISVRCSKGTYIRTLIADIGERLGVGGIMTGLVRKEASGFSLKDCISLEQAQELAENGELEQQLLPIDRLFLDCPPLRLNDVQSRMFQNGVRLDLSRIAAKKSQGRCRVYAADGCFLGLAVPDGEQKELRIEKLFLSEKE